MSDIPNEAIEAAEEALRSDMWSGDPEDIPPNMRTEAELAVTAAAPIIRADERRRIAEEIRVEMRRHDNAQVGFSAVGDAYAHAARISERSGE